MRLSSEDDEDDYYLDDDFEDEAPRKGLFSKRNNTEPEDEPDAQDKPRFLGRSNPVSYTHLDVYKRQRFSYE